MFDLFLPDVAFGLFDVYLFVAYWFLRFTCLDRLLEKLLLNYAKNANVKVKLVYKRNRNEEVEEKFENGKSPTPTIVVADRRVFAKFAAYPTLGLAESFIVRNNLILAYLNYRILPFTLFTRAHGTFIIKLN